MQVSSSSCLQALSETDKLHPWISSDLIFAPPLAFKLTRWLWHLSGSCPRRGSWGVSVTRIEEDTQHSCVSGLTHGGSSKIWRCFPFAFSVLLHRYEGLLTRPVLKYNSRPFVHLTGSATWLSVWRLLVCSLDGTGKIFVVLFQGISLWPFTSGWSLCWRLQLGGRALGKSESNQLNFRFLTGMCSWFLCQRGGAIGITFCVERARVSLTTWGNHTFSIISTCSSVLKYLSPISGFWRIPTIRCNLSMATLCWKLLRPLSYLPIFNPFRSSITGLINLCRSAHLCAKARSPSEVEAGSSVAVGSGESTKEGYVVVWGQHSNWLFSDIRKDPSWLTKAWPNLELVRPSWDNEKDLLPPHSPSPSDKKTSASSSVWSLSLNRKLGVEGSDS